MAEVEDEREDLRVRATTLPATDLMGIPRMLAGSHPQHLARVYAARGHAARVAGEEFGGGVRRIALVGIPGSWFPRLSVNVRGSRHFGEDLYFVPLMITRAPHSHTATHTQRQTIGSDARHAAYQ